MKQKIAILILVLIISYFLFYYSKNFSQKIEYSVIGVIDGDTIKIKNGQFVRLLGINAPEKGELYYNESTQELKRLVLGKKVKLEKDVVNKDRYKRLLRYVYIDDIFVNKIMLKQGYARIDIENEMKYGEQLKNAEKFAKENKLGIWSFD